MEGESGWGAACVKHPLLAERGTWTDGYTKTIHSRPSTCHICGSWSALHDGIPRDATLPEQKRDAFESSRQLGYGIYQSNTYSITSPHSQSHR